jgi:hypothetical protein
LQRPRTQLTAPPEIMLTPITMDSRMPSSTAPDAFDDFDLNFLYSEQTAEGQMSRFFKFVRKE